MQPSIAVIGAGLMGAGIAGRLREKGLTVLTDLDGRSEASRTRAESAGMVSVSPEELVSADLILSIIPPGEAVTVAERYALLIARAEKKPAFAELNAISPETTRRIADIIETAGSPFIDGCIIGGPPAENDYSPAIYASGPESERVRILADYGIRFQKLDAPVGGASALKMCYGGVQKGIIAVGAANILAASRAGVGDALRAELASSLPDLLNRFEQQVPASYSRAHRWVAEMEEISSFIGPDFAEAEIYSAIAGFFQSMSDDYSGDRSDIARLEAFLNGK